MKQLALDIAQPPAPALDSSFLPPVTFSLTVPRSFAVITLRYSVRDSVPSPFRSAPRRSASLAMFSATPSTSPTTALYFYAFSNGVNGGTWTVAPDLFTEGTVAGNSNSSTVLVADIDRKTQTTFLGRTAGNSGLAASTGNATMVVVLGRNP